MSICVGKAGVNVGQSLFTDTDYADDAVLFAEDDVQWPSILESFIRCYISRIWGEPPAEPICPKISMWGQSWA